MKNAKQPFLLWGLFIACWCYVTFMRIFYHTPYSRSWDQVDFVLAVSDFDLYQMQPHFPGYPYFILGGMLVNFFIKDPLQAVTLFNVFMLALSVIPILLILNSYMKLSYNLLVTAVIYSMSYLWAMSTDPMSEAAGVAVVWWFLWSLKQAKEKQSFYWALLPSLFFSILMGIRLSYAPFGIGILLLWYSYRHNFRDWLSYFKFIIFQLLLALVFQAVWVIALMVSAGGVFAFIELAIGFVGGHFTEWGGAVTAASTPFIHRLSRLVFHNFLWTGLFSQSIWLTGIYILCFGLFIVQLNRIKWKTDTFTYWLIIIWSSYFIWVLFAQNVDKPRHILPLTGLFVLLLLKALFMQRFVGIVKLISILLIIVQSIIGSYLTEMKTEEPPAVYQLTDYLEEINDPMLVFTWEEARVMEYRKVTYPYKEIFTFEYFLLELPKDQQTRVFLTNQVVEGFKNQGHQVEGKIKEVEVFHSNPIFDPVYGTVILYEWVDGKTE